MNPKSNHYKFLEPNLNKQRSFARSSRAGFVIFSIVAFLVGLTAAGCDKIIERRDVRPLVMHDVPAQRLAYRLEADTGLPSDIKVEDSSEKAAEIQTDFNTNRKDDALLRTVVSPDGQRVLALYGTADEPNEAFRIDLYAADGKFLRNLTPPELSCAFPETVNWSPDGNYISFIAHKSLKPSPSPTPADDVPVSAAPGSSPAPSVAPSVAPVFAPVASFNTEQIYICNRDGYELKPLSGREGLIYFYAAWAPDSHALAALACKEDEWNAREKEFKLPAGRPRLLTPEGNERLLDDQMTEALPVWSPDASKVATAFDSDVGIYDAATNKPTQGRLALREALIAASRAFEEKGAAAAQKNSNQAAGQTQLATDELPASFNPIVRLAWPAPEKLYIKTAYVRLMTHDTINTFQRWHLIALSPQAAILK
jgi:dipeptidyl aminopeptidase/acylaminoacyl peptidase